jgi:hypothetical protein
VVEIDERRFGNQFELAVAVGIKVKNDHLGARRYRRRVMVTCERPKTQEALCGEPA